LRCVLQRVTDASVTVDQLVVATMGPGLLIYTGIAPKDQESIVKRMAEKIVHMRLFADPSGKMNESLLDKQYGVTLISQFTLFADCQKGNRPYFGQAAEPTHAENLYNFFKETLKPLCSVQSGLFSKMMDIRSTGQGPVTIILDSNDLGWS
jgi:D-tyrosyl-tRNA(Tyr) deacylase